MDVEFDSSPENEQLTSNEIEHAKNQGNLSLKLTVKSPEIAALKRLKLMESGKKGAKKRKKKTLTEPQKPVSAYALFFKDTQSAIKAENSMATFGEISKIVASMWDSLSEEAKQVYKQKTETAKREYLKQLAAYRAAKQEEEGEDEPLFILQDKLKQQRTAAAAAAAASASNSDLPPPPKLKIAPVLVAKGIHLLQAQPSVDSRATNVDVSNTNVAETSPNQSSAQNLLQNATSPTFPPPIQLRNIVPKAQGPITIIQSKPGQVIKLLPASQASSIASNSNGRNRIIKMADLIKNGSSPTQQPQSPQEDDVQPILQTLAQETGALEDHSSGPEVENGTEGQLSIAKGEVILIDDENLLHGSENFDENIENSHTANIRVCIRDGCENLAISDPQWHDEYCSSTCVVKHCRDVFDAWTSLRRTKVSAG